MCMHACTNKQNAEEEKSLRRWPLPGRLKKEITGQVNGTKTLQLSFRKKIPFRFKQGTSKEKSLNCVKNAATHSSHTRGLISLTFQCLN
ncbi:hypothetical protein CEXT_31531 [Caerostris extrusa]|uniref:Uncharacterized protein n=1 Tax=Caerostris extrusa TaxID=172846 RepID=A0AAV4UEV1_CAEEX|nr:hypothetical protein CEXT_31531 [Caerostris extrusa]